MAQVELIMPKMGVVSLCAVGFVLGALRACAPLLDKRNKGPQRLTLRQAESIRGRQPEKNELAHAFSRTVISFAAKSSQNTMVFEGVAQKTPYFTYRN